MNRAMGWAMRWAVSWAMRRTKGWAMAGPQGTEDCGEFKIADVHWRARGRDLSPCLRFPHQPHVLLNGTTTLYQKESFVIAKKMWAFWDNFSEKHWHRNEKLERTEFENFQEKFRNIAENFLAQTVFYSAHDWYSRCGVINTRLDRKFSAKLRKYFWKLWSPFQKKKPNLWLF